ncbi:MULTISPECIES: hypothetical protein [unclassified Haladaptatus]|uniref:hypothetical protein n=1 Tax=unclassified Haladaptatus TaxID=2622732 RepID=UPI00209C69F4|nr:MULTISPECIES: hypothetical protein [unclassified Haladaptatus]MCO8243209.1 hypothetical protein [Haladaptatus sp. AB643]MCO8252921.1 hypothetical protein [Haladaptatus sp. AB618]
MDESPHQTQLDRIERRQKYILALLIGGYLIWFATIIDVVIAAFLYFVLGVTAFVLITIHRHNRDTAEQ